MMMIVEWQASYLREATFPTHNYQPPPQCSMRMFTQVRDEEWDSSLAQ